MRRHLKVTEDGDVLAFDLQSCFQARADTAGNLATESQAHAVDMLQPAGCLHETT